MAKKRSWFNLVKRFFISEKESKQDKGSRRRWVFWGKLRIKSRPPSIAAPSPPRERRKNSNESKEEQSRHALDVALASAAAAEAAVAAAHIAAEVVWLANAPQSTHGCDKDTGGENSSIKAHFTHQDERHIVVQQSAAIRIQTAYRSYLARKALRALKGIVKLQAIIRGRNVRRQAMNTLKCLQSIVSIQSQVCAKRIQMVEATAWPCDDEPKQFQTIRDKIIKMDTNSQRRWDGSILTKDEADAMFLSKKEAAMKRERIKEYSFTHRNSAETERSKVNGRLKQWLEQWVENQVGKSKEVEDLDSVLTSNPNPRLEHKGKHLKLRGSPRQNQVEGLDTSPISAPRRSFHKKQCSLGDDSSFSGTSPVMVPTYMAATESAKAKARSMSSPKLRPCGGYDAYSDSYSPCKNKLGVFSSANPETPASAKFGRPNSLYQQRSPSLKGLLPGPVKSSRTLQDLSFDSECSFKTWNPQSNTSFR